MSGKHETEMQSDGSVVCKTCGEKSARMGTVARAREWGVSHRRQVRAAAKKASS